MYNLRGPIAVVDVETTGLFTSCHHRVIEVGIAIVDSQGNIQREFVSLVNPGRDLGPTHIHGITAEDVALAPTFGEIAKLLFDAMTGCVAIAGHNVRFDRQFLEAEFLRLGISLPDCHSLCTMELAGGGGLIGCCRDYGVAFDRAAHHALDDALAAAGLLSKLFKDEPRLLASLAEHEPIAWPSLTCTTKPPCSRTKAREIRSSTPTFIQRIAQRASDQGALAPEGGNVMAYTALLDRVLEDRRIDDTESDALVAMATQFGLSAKQVENAHLAYVEQLAIAAVMDGVVTNTERRDLETVARLLGLEVAALDQMLNLARERLATETSDSSNAHSTENLFGKKVCFTGELQCRQNSQLITRESAEEIAEKAGLVVQSSVTKKLDLLVLADPHTQSGKAKKARQYGVRIMHEPVFWKAIGIEVE